MGLTKPNNYEVEEIKFTLIANALGHPARNRIVDLIQIHSFVRNIDLPPFLNLHPATVTQHIHCLKKSGLIKTEYFIHYDVLRLDEDILDYFVCKVAKIANKKILNCSEIQ